MSIDIESKALVKELSDFEERILSNEIITEITLDAFKSLKSIYGNGKNSPINIEIERFKTMHKTQNVEEMIKKTLVIEKGLISVTRARIPMIVNKNSVISAFLADKGKMSWAKLRKFHAFFKKNNINIEEALASNNKAKVKKILLEYIQILKSNENYLEQNLIQSSKDVNFAWSLHNLMAHEFVHQISLHHMKPGDRKTNKSLHEAVSFAVQKLSYTYQKNFKFTKSNLIKEINTFEPYINPREHAYDALTFKFMKPLFYLICSIMLCDSIARKESNTYNNKFFVKAHSQKTVSQLYSLAEQAIAKLNNKQFQQIINQLVNKSIQYLHSCKAEIEAHLKNEIKALPKYISRWITPNKQKGGFSLRPWRNIKHATHIIFADRIRPFVNHYELLKLLVHNSEAENYKAEFLIVLEKQIERVLRKYPSAEADVLAQEKGVVNTLLKAMNTENEIIIELVNKLN
jgi:hypothetical protein